MSICPTYACVIPAAVELDPSFNANPCNLVLVHLLIWQYLLVSNISTHDAVIVEEKTHVVADRFLSYVYTCTESKRNCVLRVLHESHELLETGGEQRLVVWSWSDARIIA
jgi:hypothetical protein